MQSGLPLTHTLATGLHDLTVRRSLSVLPPATRLVASWMLCFSRSVVSCLTDGCSGTCSMLLAARLFACSRSSSNSKQDAAVALAAEEGPCPPGGVLLVHS
jgi:hypothetical protein